MIELRGHHLLCTSLFQGSGYSEEFVKRMTEVVEKCIPKEKKREKTNKKHLVEEEIDESAVCSCTYAKKWQKIKEEEYPV